MDKESLLQSHSTRKRSEKTRQTRHDSSIQTREPKSTALAILQKRHRVLLEQRQERNAMADSKAKWNHWYVVDTRIHSTHGSTNSILQVQEMVSLRHRTFQVEKWSLVMLANVRGCCLSISIISPFHVSFTSLKSQSSVFTLSSLRHRPTRHSIVTKTRIPTLEHRYEDQEQERRMVERHQATTVCF